MKSIDVSFDSLAEIHHAEDDDEDDDDEKEGLMHFNSDSSMVESSKSMKAVVIPPIARLMGDGNSNVESEYNGCSKLEILLKSNFVNLEEISIQNCDRFTIADVETLVNAEAKGQVSIRFDFIGLLNQITEGYLHSRQQTSKKQSR